MLFIEPRQILAINPTAERVQCSVHSIPDRGKAVRWCSQGTKARSSGMILHDHILEVLAEANVLPSSIVVTLLAPPRDLKESTSRPPEPKSYHPNYSCM